MKIEILEAFVAVCDLQTFSAAAEALYLSQPTISRYISDLEKELGSPLLDRGARSALPNELGKEVYLYGKRILQEWKNLQNAARFYQSIGQQTMRIGYTYNGMLPMISQALSGSHLINLGYDLTLRYGDGEQLNDMVSRGQLDCAVMHQASLPANHSLRVTKLAKSHVCALVHKSSPLANLKSMTMTELSRRTDIRDEREKLFYQVFDEAMRSTCLPQMKHIYVSTADDCFPYLYCSDSLVLTTSLYPPKEDCICIPIADCPVNYDLICISPFNSNPPVVNILQNALIKQLQG